MENADGEQAGRETSAELCDQNYGSETEDENVAGGLGIGGAG